MFHSDKQNRNKTRRRLSCQN